MTIFIRIQAATVGTSAGLFLVIRHDGHNMWLPVLT